MHYFCKKQISLSLYFQKIWLNNKYLVAKPVGLLGKLKFHCLFNTHKVCNGEIKYFFYSVFLHRFNNPSNLMLGLAEDWRPFTSSSAASKAAKGASWMGCLSTSSKESWACRPRKPNGSHGSHTQLMQQRPLSNESEWEQNGTLLLNDDSWSLFVSLGLWKW